VPADVIEFGSGGAELVIPLSEYIWAGLGTIGTGIFAYVAKQASGLMTKAAEFFDANSESLSHIFEQVDVLHGIMLSDEKQAKRNYMLQTAILEIVLAVVEAGSDDAQKVKVGAIKDKLMKEILADE